MGKSSRILGFALLLGLGWAMGGIAGEADLEARLIMLQRAEDGGPTFAVRKNNQAKVKIKNNGPDEVAGAIEFQVFPGRVTAQGDPIYRKVSKLPKMKAGEMLDVAFEGIEISEEGYYLIQAMIVTLDDDVDPKQDNNQVTRRPSRARKFTKKD